MSKATGFWSYVHRDDDTEGQRITRLATDLAGQYELITGEPIHIFVDRADIEWGDEWRGAIDASLATITFFMPVLTPRYFQSEECRREFNSFARRAYRLGVKELVMPILYVSFPALDADPAPDELMALAKSFQWEDWTELRFDALDSPRYRAAAARMANRLAKAAMLVEQVDATSEVEADVAEQDDDTPGFVDRVARAETALGEWKQTLEEVAAKVNQVGEITQAAGERIHRADARGKGMSGRLPVLRELAHDLSGPADDVQDLSNKFTSQMNDVDSGMKAIFDQADKEVQSGALDRSSEQLGEFFDQLREMSESAEAGLSSLQGMVDAISGVENQSRNLRPVLRKLRRGLAVLVDGRAVIQNWVKLADDFQTPPDA